MALNSLQYNGRYGCANCLDHGKRIGKRQLFPPDAPHTPRCESDMLKWAEDAEANGKPMYFLLTLTSQKMFLWIICMQCVKVFLGPSCSIIGSMASIVSTVVTLAKTVAVLHRGRGEGHGPPRNFDRSYNKISKLQNTCW